MEIVQHTLRYLDEDSLLLTTHECLSDKMYITFCFDFIVLSDRYRKHDFLKDASLQVERVSPENKNHIKFSSYVLYKYKLHYYLSILIANL
jgi:hypothetical protein